MNAVSLKINLVYREIFKRLFLGTLGGLAVTVVVVVIVVGMLFNALDLEGETDGSRLFITVALEGDADGSLLLKSVDLEGEIDGSLLFVCK